MAKKTLVNGRKIRRLMKRAGLRQVDVAKVAGISQGHLSAIINQKVVNPRYTTLCGLAEALGVQARELVADNRF